MKRIAMITALCCTAFAGAVWCAATVWDSSNFSMEERKWQECPTDVVAGANDGVGDFAVSALHGDADGATGLSSGQVTGKVYVFLGRDVQTDGSATQAAAATGLSRGERDLHYGTFLAPFEQGGVAKLLVGAPTANRLTGTVYVEDLPDGQ